MKFLLSSVGLVSRDNYVKFILWSILTIVVVAMFTAVYFTLIVAVTITYGSNNITSIGLTVLAVFLILFVLLYTVVEFIVTTKRLRSAGKNTKLVFLGFIGLFIIPLILGLVCTDMK